LRAGPPNAVALPLRPAWLGGGLIAAPFLIAGLILAWMGNLLVGTVTGGLLASLGVVSVWNRAWLLGSRAAISVELRADGQGWAILRNSERRPIRRTDAFVSRWLVILPLDSRSGDSVLVTPDMLVREGHRVLRVWALWGGVATADHGSNAGTTDRLKSNAN